MAAIALLAVAALLAVVALPAAVALLAAVVLLGAVDIAPGEAADLVPGAAVAPLEFGVGVPALFWASFA